MVRNRWTDGQIDGQQKKWQIEVGAPPKKTISKNYKPMRVGLWPVS